MGFSGWVIQTGPCAAVQPFKPILSPKFFNLFTVIMGSPFLSPQSANYEKGEFFQLNSVRLIEPKLQCFSATAKKKIFSWLSR